MNLIEAKRECAVCQRCPLSLARTQSVFGEGPLDAELFIIGEAPGANEDFEGRPFVGNAGDYLNDLLMRAGLRREDVYVTNAAKCRPPGNRDPKKEEIAACRDYLRAELEAVEPRLILAMGRAATKVFMGDRKFTVRDMRDYVVYTRVNGEAIPVRFTYHPASIIYDGDKYDLVLEDLQDAVEWLRKEV